MDLRLNRAEIVEAIGDYATRQISESYGVSGVKLDGNGQGATVTLVAERIEPDSPVVVELDTKDDKPTKTAAAKEKARAKAAEK